MYKLLLTIAVIGFIACNRNEKTENFQELSSIAQTDQPEPKTPAIQYWNQSCVMASGGVGCECAVSSLESDCSLLTECTASTDLHNYHVTLNSMFTSSEILSRAVNQVRITEPELVNALILDGWPVIPPTVIPPGE